jgi:putative membrane protein
VVFTYPHKEQAALTTMTENQDWRYPAILLASFCLLWIGLAIAPLYRQDWLLEFVFFALHELGAHYTYSLVPYDAWFTGLTGHSLNAMLGFERNHYDRLIHFLYGLLVTPAAVELFARYGRYPRTWAALFPLLFVASHSVIYELIEWGAAMVFGGDLGQAYLGTQGDIWDAQKDMALAMLGAIVSITVLGLARRLPVRHD